MSVLDWFKGLNPQAQAALLGGGMNLLGGISTGMGLEGQQEDSQAHQLEIARMNNLASLYGADNQRYIAAQNAIGSPLAIQRERAGMAMLGDMLGNGGSARATQQVFAPPHIAPYQGRVGGGSGSGGTNFSRAGQFLTNDAMANAEVPFWQNLSALNPDINPNLQNAGYGQSPGAAYASGMIDQSRLGNATRQQMEKNAIFGALGGQSGGGAGMQGPAPKGYEYDKKTGQLKKKGGGFWKTLGKIGLGIGGGIATAMTGGAAAPLLGAAFGAASGALDNGWKGALTGGALGGLTGGLGGGSAASAAKQGFGQAVKSTLANPQVLTRAAGMGIGGPMGTALQLGSTMMPTDFTPGTTNGLPNVINKNKLGTQLPGQVQQKGPFDNVPWGFGGTMGGGAFPKPQDNSIGALIEMILGGGGGGYQGSGVPPVGQLPGTRGGPLPTPTPTAGTTGVPGAQRQSSQNPSLAVMQLLMQMDTLRKGGLGGYGGTPPFVPSPNYGSNIVQGEWDWIDKGGGVFNYGNPFTSLLQMILAGRR